MATYALLLDDGSANPLHHLVHIRTIERLGGHLEIGGEHFTGDVVGVTLRPIPVASWRRRRSKSSTANCEVDEKSGE